MFPNSSTLSTNTASPDVDLFANSLQDSGIRLMTDDDVGFDAVVVQSIHGVRHRPHCSVVYLHSVQLYAAADLSPHEIHPIPVGSGVPSVIPKSWA